MTGEKIGKLLKRWRSGVAPYLDDSELAELRAGLQFLYEFSQVWSFEPMILYYSIQLSDVKRALEARKEK